MAVWSLGMQIGVVLFISVVAHRLNLLNIVAGYLNRAVIYGYGGLYNEGPSQFSLLNRPNHDCLWGKVISFSLMKPPVWRCCINLSRTCEFLGDPGFTVWKSRLTSRCQL